MSLPSQTFIRASRAAAEPWATSATPFIHDEEEPAVPVYANVTAAPESDPDTIRSLLVEQVTGLVRWRETVIAMAAGGVEDFIELGGKVLGPMVKRSAPDVNVRSIVTIEDIEALAKEIA